jgi:hypothetical protein
MRMRTLAWFVVVVAVLLGAVLAHTADGGASLHDWFMRLHGR